MNSASPSERLRLALELSAFAEGMMRQRFQEENPEATEEQIEERLLRWMAGADYENLGGKRPRRQVVAG